MVQQATRPPIAHGQWHPMTWDEFIEWAPSDVKAEWVDGKGIAVVSTTTRHARMLSFFASLLGLYVHAFSIGEVFFDNVLMRLSTRPSGREPDIMVVLAEHQDRVLKRWHEGPADFVVEFVSDDDPERDIVVKFREYEAAGVPEYLWVDSREGFRDFRFYRHTETGYQIVEPDAKGRYHAEVLPGFWFDPAWFWEDPLPDVTSLMWKIAPRAFREYIFKFAPDPSDEDEENNA